MAVPTPISGLPSATPASGDLAVIVHSGVTSKTTLGDILDLSPVTSVAGRTGAITLVSTDISNSTATGRAVLTAADAAAARSAIGAGTGNALTSGTLGQFAATTSAELAGVLSDETGSGSAVFSASPTLTGTVVVRQTGGTAGTDEGHISYASNYLNLSSPVHGIRLKVPFGKAVAIDDGSGGDRFRMNSGILSVPTFCVATPTTSYGWFAQGGIYLPGNATIGFNSGNSNFGLSADIGISRVDSNTVEVNNGTRTASGGALRGLSVSSLTASGAAIFRGTSTTDVTLGYGNVRCSGSTNPRLILDGGTTGQVTQLDNASGIFRILSASSLLVAVSSAGNLTASGLVSVGTYTVATLPSASANAGAFAQVTDSNSTTNGNTVAGGGANRVPVFSNGTNWIIK